ncbi:hypothetical protein ACIBEA_43685 [Streptomyces sp. NPDC051555]|uniref:hypothetical protein n=1 Tax=Streptomyces sp. NPDC051555 TaxID=3365657 RepID=UPI0037B07956
MPAHSEFQKARPKATSKKKKKAGAAKEPEAVPDPDFRELEEVVALDELMSILTKEEEDDLDRYDTKLTDRNNAFQTILSTGESSIRRLEALRDKHTKLLGDKHAESMATPDPATKMRLEKEADEILQTTNKLNSQISYMVINHLGILEGGAKSGDALVDKRKLWDKYLETKAYKESMKTRKMDRANERVNAYGNIREYAVQHGYAKARGDRESTPDQKSNMHEFDGLLGDHFAAGEIRAQARGAEKDRIDKLREEQRSAEWNAEKEKDRARRRDQAEEDRMDILRDMAKPKEKSGPKPAVGGPTGSPGLSLLARTAKSGFKKLGKVVVQADLTAGIKAAKGRISEPLEQTRRDLIKARNVVKKENGERLKDKVKYFESSTYKDLVVDENILARDKMISEKRMQEHRDATKGLVDVLKQRKVQKLEDGIILDSIIDTSLDSVAVDVTEATLYQKLRSWLLAGSGLNITHVMLADVLGMQADSPEIRELLQTPEMAIARILEQRSNNKGPVTGLPGSDVGPLGRLGFAIAKALELTQSLWEQDRKAHMPNVDEANKNRREEWQRDINKNENWMEKLNKHKADEQPADALPTEASQSSFDALGATAGAIGSYVDRVLDRAMAPGTLIGGDAAIIKGKHNPFNVYTVADVDSDYGRNLNATMRAKQAADYLVNALGSAYTPSKAPTGMNHFVALSGIEGKTVEKMIGAYEGKVPKIKIHWNSGIRADKSVRPPTLKPQPDQLVYIAAVIVSSTAELHNKIGTGYDERKSYADLIKEGRISEEDIPGPMNILFAFKPEIKIAPGGPAAMQGALNTLGSAAGALVDVTKLFHTAVFKRLQQKILDELPSPYSEVDLYNGQIMLQLLSRVKSDRVMKLLDHLGDEEKNAFAKALELNAYIVTAEAERAKVFKEKPVNSNLVGNLALNGLKAIANAVATALDFAVGHNLGKATVFVGGVTENDVTAMRNIVLHSYREEVLGVDYTANPVGDKMREARRRKQQEKTAPVAPKQVGFRQGLSNMGLSVTPYMQRSVQSVVTWVKLGSPTEVQPDAGYGATHQPVLILGSAFVVNRGNITIGEVQLLKDGKVLIILDQDDSWGIQVSADQGPLRIYQTKGKHIFTPEHIGDNITVNI